FGWLTGMSTPRGPVFCHIHHQKAGWLFIAALGAAFSRPEFSPESPISLISRVVLLSVRFSTLVVHCSMLGDRQ
ncbi:hypothetical protein OS128_11045, partial [Corynebacterium sp. P5848]|uniref:hypothetical protein n=1 Tax=Corynebacterium marambiense TaxID=2765364 RepID=UPI002260C562